ncbi:MAG: hypothetical protein WCF93_02215 [Candidatus Moraniibacteriota bacterium]
MSLCTELKTEYAELEELEKQFEVAFDEAVKTGKLEKAQQIKTEIENKLASLKEKIIPKEIKAIFTNPENNKQKEIKFNLAEQIKTWQQFYQTHNLPIPNEQEIKNSWRKNQKEIQKAMETYGFDKILIIPENLPATEELHTQMSQGYTETYQSENFKKAGSFAGAKHTETQKTRIILCHNDQNMYQNPEANFFAKQTLSKNILQLSGLTEAQLNAKIQNQENIPLDFETQINNQKIQIQAEGLSLNEYLILQKQYFQENQKHLDEKGWTWLTKTSSASRIANASWHPGYSQLHVDADDLGTSNDVLGCRLSRSFSS